ncbi:MAG: hypothetical protein IJY71_06060 [Clostridia bacterium]|nr:hypothetical protein [Clostridia bacterium]
MLKEHKPAVLYIGALLLLQLALCLATPFIYEELVYDGSVLAIPVYYILQFLGWLSPVLMFAVLGYSLCRYPLATALLPFYVYAGIQLLFQIPTAFLSPLSDAPLFDMLLLGANALFSSLCFLLVALLGYFLLIRSKTPMHAPLLFAKGDTALYFLGLAVILHTAYQVIARTVDFIIYLSKRLFMGSGADYADFFISIFFYLLFGFVALVLGRLLQNAFFENDAA